MATVSTGAKKETQVLVKTIGVLMILMQFGLISLVLFLSRGQPNALPHTMMLMGAGFVFVFVFLPGLLIYLGGFNCYKQFRKLANLPRIPIRSVPMGLVEIQGHATADTMVIAPVTHTRCCAYRLTVDRSDVKNQELGTKITLAEVEDGKFYLEDESGRIAVDLRNLEFDGLTPYRHMVQMGSTGGTIVYTGFFNSPPVPGMADDGELRAYVRKLVPQFPAPHASLYEYLIVPGPLYSLTGTCVEDPHATGEGDRKIIRKGLNDPEFRLTNRTREGEIQKLRRRAHALIGIGAAVAFLGILLTAACVEFAVLSANPKMAVMSSPRDLNLDACKQAVGRFHTMFEAGLDDAIYDAADPEYRTGLTRESSHERFSSIRQKMGSFKSAEFQYSESVPEGTTNGALLRLDYIAQFARGTMDEDFTCHIDGQSALLSQYKAEPAQHYRFSF